MAIGIFDLRRGPYGRYQPQAMVGMRANAMVDNVDTLTAGVEEDEILPFGVVVCWPPSDPNDLHIVPGGPVAGYRGISLRDHLHEGVYRRYDCVSVLTRGRVWAHVRNPQGVMDGVAVRYAPATGEVQATGGIAVPNAMFRSIAILLPDEVAVALGAGGEWAYGAIVELHAPGV